MTECWVLCGALHWGRAFCPMPALGHGLPPDTPLSPDTPLRLHVLLLCFSDPLHPTFPGTSQLERGKALFLGSGLGCPRASLYSTFGGEEIPRGLA